MLMSLAMILAAAGGLPGGWVALAAPPSESDLACANWSSNEWAVTWANEGLAVARIPPSSRSDPLPFTISGTLAMSRNERWSVEARFAGRSRVLRVHDGYLIGFDRGEWGGGLWWFDSTGSSRKRLEIPAEARFEPENVVAIRPAGEDAIAFIGLAHLQLDEGKAVLVSRGQGHPVRVLASFGAAPRAVLTEADGTWLVLTHRGLFRLAMTGGVELVAKLDGLDGLNPESMARSPSGSVFIGMRHYVLQVDLKGDQIRQSWLVREECVTSKQEEFDCRCTGAPKSGIGVSDTALRPRPPSSAPSEAEDQSSSPPQKKTRK